MLFGNSRQRNDWWSLWVQGEKIPELGKEIKGLKLKTNEPLLGLDTNLSEQGPVTLEELRGNTLNVQHCQTWRVNVLDDCHQLHCYLLFSCFYSSSPAEIQTQPPRCCANTGQENPPASRANHTSCSEKHPACHAWVCKGQGEVPGCEAGAEPACQHQPCPCPALPLPKAFLVFFKCLTWVQESGTWGKVPGLCPEGSIQCAGINTVGCFPSVIAD